MKLKEMISSTTCLVVLLNLLIMIFIKKTLMTADIPVSYSLEELKDLSILAIVTSMVLFLLLLFTRKYILYTLSIYAILLIFRVVSMVNNQIDEVTRLDQLLLFMVLCPFIGGFFLIKKKNTRNQHL